MAASNIGRPLQLLELDPAGQRVLKLDTSVLKDVFGRSEVKDLPVMILSVIGAFRTGKSFLLNFLIRYLKAATGSENWLGDSTEELCGFAWKPGASRTTLGILIWSQPFVLNRNGKRIAVVLMDTQGLFDQSTAPGDANMIVSISTLLSSLQVYNVMGKIDERHLSCLELFVETGKLVLSLDKKIGPEKPFQRLTFLVRDWIDAKQYKYGSDGGLQYLKEKMKIDMLSKQPKELCNVRENIAKCFETLDCYLMPHPGLRATQTKGDDSSDEEYEEFSGKISDLDRKFTKYMKKVVGSFFGELAVKKCGSREMTGHQMMEYCVKCVDIFCGNRLPKPDSTRKAILEQYNHMILDDILSEYKFYLEKRIGTDMTFPSSEEEQEILKTAGDKARRIFNENVRGNHEEIMKVQENFNKSIGDYERGFMNVCNYRRLTSKREKESRCLDQMKAAKTRYLTLTKGDQSDKFLKFAKDQALQQFLDKTDDCREERDTYRAQLEEFINDREQYLNYLRIFSEEADNRNLLRQAKDQYEQKMNQSIYRDKSKKTEDDVHSCHGDAYRHASSLLDRNLKGTDSQNRKFKDELEEFCALKRERYIRVNQEQTQKREQEDQVLLEYTLMEAMQKYRHGMGMICSIGCPYLSNNAFDREHASYSRSAESVLREKMSGRSSRAEQMYWRKLQNALEEDKRTYKSQNEMNNPARSKKEVVPEVKKSRTCSVQ